MVNAHDVAAEVAGERLLDKSKVAEYLGVTTRCVDMWVGSGRLPQPLRLPNGRPRWRQSEIRAVPAKPANAV